MNDRPPDTGTNKSALVLKLSQCLDLEEEDLRWIVAFEGASESLPAGTDIVKQNGTYESAAVLLEGWCMKYKLLPDGQRQVVNFLLPGAFIGLHANLFQVTDHAISTLTRCRVSSFEPQLVTRIFRERPLLAAAIVWDHAREEALLMERLASLGRRTAYERLAHLLVELAILLSWRGQDLRDGAPLPIPQAVVADTLGLSLVHVSRTIQKLREEGLLENNNNHRGIVLRDLAGLMAVCGYDETYLHKSRLPEKTVKSIGG